MQQPISNSGVNDNKATVVVPPYDKERSECWEGDFVSQFPVNTQGQPDGMATLCVNSPHEGFRIEAQIVNGNMQGKASVYSNANILVAEVTFEAGIANGPCKLFDTTGKLFFEGNLKSGYRSGRGKEYDREGRILFDGYFKKGKRMNLVPSNEMRGYWKEYSDDGTLLSVSEVNKDTGEKEGMSVKYKEGEFLNIRQIKDGKETEYRGFIKFYIEFKNAWFEGNIDRGAPNGYCEIYDTDGKYIFKGLMSDGRVLTVKKMFGKGGYQKEYDYDEHLVNICKRDENYRFDGICYHFDRKEMIREIIEWSEGEVIDALAEFDGHIMTEYENKVKVYEGEYIQKSDFEYVPNGLGKEFDSDGETVIYEGYYHMGKRHGLGKLYQGGELVYDDQWILGKKKDEYYIQYSIIFIAVYLVLICLPYIFDLLNLTTVSLIDLFLTILFFLYVLKIYCCGINYSFDLLIAKLLHKRTLRINNGRFYSKYTFDAPLFAKYINIGDECFTSCVIFRIDGLNRLKSVKVGNDSFNDVHLRERFGKSFPFSFSITNCLELESVDFGTWSFYSFSEEVVFRNLPSLKYITIGRIGKDSHNFGGSLTIRGTHVLLIA